ncbi:MAG: 4Fe-4S dicluster domain-containing protein [Candidatus Kapabacteria bacterium]|nr:4Fe-4S dicluster domain-containing protein [Candidatus Kapabacteria bacterium]
MKRRDFISYISSSLALLSVSCQRPEHKVVPAVNPSEFSKPGNPVYFNSAFQLKNCAYGITVKTFDGKPIKIDGNFEHPSTFGVINPLIQASLYSLYDPSRFFQPEINGVKKNKDELIQLIHEKIQNDSISGKKIIVFYNENASPSYHSLIQKIKEKNNNIIFVRYSAFKSHLAEVNKTLFGIDAEFVPDFNKADLIIDIEADILGTHKLSPFFAKKLSQRKSSGTKLISIESNYTLTGIHSDKRYTASPDELFELILKIYYNLTNNNELNTNNKSKETSSKYDKPAKEISEELLKYGERSALIPGDNLPQELLELIMLINYELKNIASDKIFNPEKLIPFSNSFSDEEREILSGRFAPENGCSIIFLETNPFYSGSQNLKNWLSKTKAEDLISISLYPDETHQRAGIKIAATHYLEKWGDAQFFDGSSSIIQPVIKPLNRDSISSEEFLLNLYQSLDNNVSFESYYDYLREFYKDSIKSWSDWASALRKGYFKNEDKSKPQNKIEFNKLNAQKFSDNSIIPNSEVYLNIIPSLNFFDDFEPNNPYLLELPDPISKITWENVGLVSKSLAQKYGLNEGDIFKLSSGNLSLEIHIYILTGIADKTIVISSGFGRKIKNSDKFFGVNPFELIKIEDEEHSTKFIPIKLEKTNKKLKLVKSQTNFTPNDDLVDRHSMKKNSIYPGYEHKGQKWGMLIDLSKCIGCNSCVISCQFENNIPIVGKEEVQKGRIMHWIKIDRFDAKENSEIYFEPMLCQHCENAPCESVCPVGATSHSPEGINEMTYNRCIGARFCMVNCPYNVRKFNYENYYEKVSSPLENMLNPEITIRMRGIAEKCTFCVHRINEMRIESKNKGMKFIPDGRIKTACQEACPTEAIIFGDLNNKNSEIARIMKEKEVFHKLEFLNTKPSVAYIKNKRNELKNA